MSLTLNFDRTRSIVDILLHNWNSTGILGSKSMPEEIIPDGMVKGSTEHALFITLTVAIDYMRNADDLWAAARKTFSDAETRYLFDPCEVVNTAPIKIQTDLLKYGVLLRPERDSHIWMTLCITLYKSFNCHIETLLENVEWNGPRIIELIRSPKYKNGFINLKGRKIAPLWLRMLKDSWGGHTLYDMEQIGLPVDVHTGAATVMLGCISGDYKGSFKTFAESVQKVWCEACQKTENYPLQLDEPLWNLSRNGCRVTRFMPCEFSDKCPVFDFCTCTRLTANSKTVGDTPDEAVFSTGVW